jgi:phosphatidyl-myo-inositol alpha-mannosyltransferase
VGPAGRGLRIDLLNGSYWPEVRRGTERVMHDLAAELARRGDQPRILTTHAGLPRQRWEDGAEVLRLPRPPGLPARLLNLQENLEHLPLIYAAMRVRSPDVANAFFFTDALAAIRWGRRLDRPVVFSYMGIPRRDVLASRRLRMRVLDRAANESDAVVALSRAARDALWRWLGVEARVIYPGVELASFPLCGDRDPVPTICCAGASDDPRKRIPMLLDAFARVRRERVDARLLLMRPRSQGYEERLRGPGVEFMDLTSERVVDMYRRAWVSVLPSYNEAFGLVLLEALACGRPVVGARDGGVPEIVDDPQLGRLFSGDDPETLARAILEALELSSDPRTPATCRARAETLSSTRTAVEYRALYADLLGLPSDSHRQN